MRKNFKNTIFLITLLMPLAVLCACVSSPLDIPRRHPAEAAVPAGRPVCTNCHEGSNTAFPFARFNHTPWFTENHSQQGYQTEQVCNMCHQQSFCTTCHNARGEMKPSERDRTGTFRRMPHRGDYLVRHRIDGRLDPTACFRCHGNPKTARQCLRCHP